MPSIHNLVILFTRYPQLGKCKTRLIPALGAEGALKTHKQLVSHILHELHGFLASRSNTDLHIYYDGGSLEQLQEWLGSKKSYRRQEGVDLGQRMKNALNHGLHKQYNTILIGSDCPGIDASLFEEGFEALKQKEIVLGPAHDGGYYLIGIAENSKPELWKQIFEDIPWGTDKVFAKTVAKAEKYGLCIHTLSKLHDIDTAEDLKHFHHRPYSE